jgi:hypothetical protein
MIMGDIRARIDAIWKRPLDRRDSGTGGGMKEHRDEKSLAV